MEDESITPEHRDFVGALASGLVVIQAFDASHRQMTLSEVAERAGMDRAKARRFLLTLHSLGFIRRDGRLFMLTPKVLSLGYAYSAGNDYLPVVEHYLHEVTAELGESCSLAVLDGQDIIYVVRSSAAHRLMSINLSAGIRLPAAYTSMGRVLAAQLGADRKEEWLNGVSFSAYTSFSVKDKASLSSELQKVSAQGYCIVDQELELGLRSLAAPAFNHKGHLVGAVNISTNALRVSLEDLKERCLPVLMAAIENIRVHTR